MDDEKANSRGGQLVDLHLLTPEDMSLELLRRGVSHVFAAESFGTVQGQGGSDKYFKGSFYARGETGKVHSLLVELREYIENGWPTD